MFTLGNEVVHCICTHRNSNCSIVNHRFKVGINNQPPTAIPGSQQAKVGRAGIIYIYYITINTSTTIQPGH